MIRISTHNDIGGITEVWKEAFGDSEEDIKFFLDEYFDDSVSLVYIEEDVVASVLFLLEGNMKISGKSYPSYYLYAACTLKRFEGRGYMTKLLSFAEKIASENNKYFICLKPGEPSLFDFYQNRGYVPFFYKKVIELDRKKVENFLNRFELPNGNNYDSNNDSVCNDLYDLREKALSLYDHFEWSEKSVNFAVKFNKYYGGECIFDCKGYMLYNICCDNNLQIFVKENTFTQSDFADSLNALLKNTDSDRFIFYLPYNYFVPFESENICDAVIKPISRKAVELISFADKPYIGLTLE